MSLGPDNFLLDLFREEVRTHVEVLSNGLVTLEQSAQDAQLIEPLMRAAHSVKGAARVVGVDAGVKVAHVMEELLVAAQRGRVLLQSGHIDLLLRGVDLLTQIGAAVGVNLDEWLRSQTARLDQTVQQLEVAASGQPLPAVTKVTEQPAASDVSSSASTDEVTQSAPPVDTAASEAPATAEQVAESNADPTDYSELGNSPLYELFRHELTSNTALALKSVDQWYQPTELGELANDLFRSAKNIRSAALIVGHRAADRLGSALERIFAGLQEDRVPDSGSALADLKRAFELLAELGKREPYELSGFMRQHAEEFATCAARLEGVILVEVAVPESTSEAPLEPPVVPLSESTVAPHREPPRATRASPSPRAVTKREAAPEPVTDQKPLPSTLRSTDSSDERVVRVTARSLTRLMGLAGESLVEAHWLPEFANELQKLKKHQQMASDLLEDALHELGEAAKTHSYYGSLLELQRKLADCRTDLTERICEFEHHTRQADDLNSRLYHEVIASRMRPLADGVHGFPRMVRDLSRQLGKKVQFEITGQSAPVDRDILEKLEAPLGHLLRNSLDHGLEPPQERLAAGKSETGSLKLTARHNAGMLSITITDDGRGIDLARLRNKVVERGLTNAETASRLSEPELLEFLFLPGFSTRDQVTEVSGRGVGLDVVHSTIYGVGGSVRLQTQLGIGTTFHLQLPTTLSVIRAVLVKIAGEPYAFPHNRIDRIFRLQTRDIASLEFKQFCHLDGRNVGLVFSRQVFQLEDAVKRPQVAAATSAPVSSLRNTAPDELCVILFSHQSEEYGLVVDEFLGEQDLVVRALDPRLGKVPNIQAAAILDDGSPSLIVDLDDLRTSVERILRTQKLQRSDGSSAGGSASERRRVLVVDDSITVREVQRQLLTQKGYDVEVAVDGADGWNRVREESFDLVISDIDMPRMNGFDFIQAIKTDSRLQKTPVIIVSYKDREEDRLRGLEVGANYYLTKSSFHDETLFDAVEELIG